MIEAPTLPQTSPAPTRAAQPRYVALLLALLVLASTGTTIAAMRHTSATFDEITTVAVGARGWHTGDWEMMPDFPPVMQYLYGLPGFLSRPNYPEDNPYRYFYARSFMFQ